ncbi:MAG TPA: ribosome small subunit-dependent GTPase A [Roseiflexaceae bacterium]|nr:ribosome small subunit-dependent GTPase A [Roseiflexaceae bacterium]
MLSSRAAGERESRSEGPGPATPDGASGRLRGTVLRAQSGFFWVQTEAGVLECTLRGRLKKERQSSDIAVIGDVVEVAVVSPGHGAIEAVLPRRTKLARRAPFTKGVWKEDVLAANVEQVLLVFSCASPEFTPRMLDRYLVLTEYSELASVIVANKVDLVGMERARELFAIYERIGYPVVYTSAKTGEGIPALRTLLEGRISVVTGKSGVGKSSLFNAVQPGLGLAVGEVSETLNKGRHTTRVAELIALDLPGGGYLADTPGIRELGLWRFPLDELDWCFREFRPFLGQCYFAGCTHTHEPDCAVRAAVEQGAITTARYESYVKLREE